MIWKRIVHSLFLPQIPDDEDKSRLAYQLNTLALAVIGLSVLFFLACVLINPISFQPSALVCLLLYDALSSDRPHHQAWPIEKARQNIIEQAGKHFDPHVVEAFLKPIDTET